MKYLTLVLILIWNIPSCQRFENNEQNQSDLTRLFIQNSNDFETIANICREKEFYLVYSKIEYKNKIFSFDFSPVTESKSNRFSFVADSSDISSTASLKSYLQTNFVAIDKGTVSLDSFLFKIKLDFNEFYTLCKFATQFKSLSIGQTSDYIEFNLPRGRIMKSYDKKLKLKENEDYYNILNIKQNWYEVTKK